ncbi:MAG: hypothetical protein ABI678_03005 [Kofleriaceae bacterium]
MTILDADQLACVTGGRGCGTMQQQQQQPQQQAQGGEQAPEAGAPQGGNFLAGLQQFLGFFQSQGFQQVLGGLQSMIGSMGGQPQQAAQSQSAE